MREENHYLAFYALLHDIDKFSRRAGVFHNIKKSLQDVYGKSNANKYDSIIQEADKLSAGLDRLQNYDNNELNYKNIRLLSIMNELTNLYEEKENKGKYFYDLDTSENYENIFPKQADDLEKINTYDSEKRYDRICSNITKEINKLNFKNKNIVRIFNDILGIAERNLIYIPSSTLNPDISLYDHLKITAAIAVCLNYENNNIKPFLLLEGDISGIQSFIYEITEGEDVSSKVSKALRGRSLFVNFLSEFVCTYIVNKLDLTLANILYCGGGVFQILLPNNRYIINKLEEIKFEIEEMLYEEFDTKLSIVFGQTSASKDDLCNNYTEVITILKNNVKNQKFVKSHSMIKKHGESFFINKEEVYGKICLHCRCKATVKESLCDTCINMIDFGDMLLNKSSVVSFVFNDEYVVGKEFKLGKIGKIILCDDIKSHLNLDYVLSIDSENKLGRYKYITKSIPRIKNEVLTFDKIAELSKGDPKLGVLKMDVDNLGYLFSNGIKSENKSISIVTSLSRMIDMFFSGYVPIICEEVSSEYIMDERENINSIFYVNYAGGDDLLIIGPWEWIIKLSKTIREKFRAFCCNNDSITLSGGIAIVDRKTPIRVNAKKADNYLEMAKNTEKKDRLCVLNYPFSWEKNNDEHSVEELLEEFEFYYKHIESDEIPRGLAFKILLASKQINNKQYRGEQLQIIPQLAYSVTRNIKNKKLAGDLKERLLTLRNNTPSVEFAKYPLTLAILKSRREEE